MFGFFDRSDRFFDLFDELAGHVASCARHLRVMAASFPDTSPEIQRIREEERLADGVAHGVVGLVNRSSVPPIHGEDVHALASGLDEIIDTIDTLAKRFPLYHIESVEPTFLRQTEVLVEATTKVNEAVHALRRSRKLSDLRQTLIEIHHQESIGDDNHHAALSHLFGGGCEPLFVLKWKELYSLIEHAIDACEDVGNVLERIVLKNA